MAVYSGVLSRPFRQVSALAKASADKQDKHRAVYIKIEHTPVFRSNLILLLIATITIVVYVFISNLLVAQRYALNLHKSEINQLNVKLTVEGRDNRGEELGVLLHFAQNYGLVEAKDTDSILEKDGFAIFDR